MNNLGAVSGTQLMEKQFAHYREILASLKTLLEHLQSGPDEMLAHVRYLKDALFCYEVALISFEEANRAVQQGIWFAAAATASSALESMLLGKAFIEARELQDSLWFKGIAGAKEYRKKYKNDFRLYARDLGLADMLEIADVLCWFPAEIGFPISLRDEFLKHVDEPTFNKLAALFPANVNLGRHCAAYVRQYRNLIHPGRCLKEAAYPSKDAGMAATLSFLIALMSLFEGTKTANIPIPSG